MIHAMARMRRRPTARSRTKNREALDLIRRALENLEALPNLGAVPPVDGEPWRVADLAPTGRAFARLLLLEAGRASTPGEQ